MQFVALALTATLLAVAQALSIHDSDTVTSLSTAAIGSHQSLEKTWVVSSVEPLRSLFVQLPGTVFVDFDPTLKVSSPSSSSSLSATAASVVAKVVVRGDSKELLDVFEVVPRSSSPHSNGSSEDRVKVHLKNTNATVRGYALTQIYVADKSALHELTTAGSSNVVISESVLATNDTPASITLRATGAGSLFVAAQEPVVVSALQIIASGLSSVRFSAPSMLVSNSVELSVLGSGDITVETHDVDAKELEASVSGPGSVFVQADSIRVSDLTSDVVGSGTVAIANSTGTCTKQSVRIAGSGVIATGAIVCRDTDVSITGSGSAVVQSTEALRVSASTSGAVQFIGARPKTVVSTVELSRFEPAAHGTKGTTVQQERHKGPPQRTVVLLALTIRAQPLADDPAVSISATREGDSATRSVPPVLFFVDCDGTESVAPVVGILVLALAAVGALILKIYYQQRRRHTYTALA